MPKSHYVMLFRRRRRGKTDYKKRKAVVISKNDFISCAITGKYVNGQIHRPSATGDITVASASSRDLTKGFGWKGSTKNIPAAYLTGYLLGKKAKSCGISKVIFYSGVGRFVHGSRVASLLNGSRDGGLEVSANEESFPDKARVHGEHVSRYCKQIQDQDKNAFSRIFSKMLASGFSPEQYPSHFDEVKAAEERAP